MAVVWCDVSASLTHHTRPPAIYHSAKGKNADYVVVLLLVNYFNNYASIS